MLEKQNVRARKIYQDGCKPLTGFAVVTWRMKVFQLVKFITLLLLMKVIEGTISRVAWIHLEMLQDS